MVPKLHAKGTSFKGLATYLLHDKDHAESADRVSWTETRNLASENPDLAWRIMAATSIDQNRLKSTAGVKNTGRKSNKHVLHMTLSWHPDQDPSREDVIEAVDGALAALGAGKYQALVVAHNDEIHPHVHVMINRVSPADGRALSSSKEKLNLSKWAQAYEEKTGIYCENRVVNNALRDNGEYVRGQKDTARHIYEAQAGLVANDNSRTTKILMDQKAKDHALAVKGRNLEKMQAGAWDKLDDAFRERKAALARALARQIEKARLAAIEETRPDWLALNRRQAKERDTFESLETSFFGRASNIARTVRLSARDVRGDETGIIKRTFGILTNAGKRKAYFDRAQQRARATLQRHQNNRVVAARKKLAAAHVRKLANARTVYFKARDELNHKQEAERAQLRGDWAKRTAERTASMARAATITRATGKARKALDAAADDPASRKAAALERSMKNIKEFDAARRGKAAKQDNERKRGRDRDDEQER